ncbi:methylmalonyl Co-A mutase-associated GTPase MeaB [Ferrovibrio terrae]|uniref:Methylmalonyl Co-A mutase-associated GTPase MeaB n=1 Tax=Ferrovibrio terrae TaxID=2594003 RepID=A0A516GY48_9PROT|nr:methylmalonyl Co-A mutase-associated GTPase MeaB [Ferrovibrio terrae]QDO96464.1 methylmalonyl Co-A mutase-associated GTPase MeaB [Ferrovibrio terrae]
MSARRTVDPDQLAEQLLSGDRRALARAITLVESRHEADRAAADTLLQKILPHTGKAIRIGISGTPGVGKSSFIERFGLYLTAQKKKVAVLAIDPSSTLSGGSILGDKTRMEQLVRDPNAFIRPSPSSGSLGGVARRTREAMLLAEAAGFDVVLVETVGVGQSETTVAEMVDIFLLLLAPGGGDDLQGIKRGIMELADVVVINKADGDLLPKARLAAADYRMALHLMRPRHTDWQPQVQMASALLNEGIDAVWTTIEDFRSKLEKSGALQAQRRHQAEGWLWRELQDGLLDWLKQDAAVASELPKLQKAVGAGKATPHAAAKKILGLLGK